MPDFVNTTWYWTPNKQNADLRLLNELPKVGVDFSYAIQNDLQFSVDLYNPSDKIAFFLELTLCNKANKEAITPVFWDDNYISLLPGERRSIKGYSDAANVELDSIEIILKGSNLE